MSAADHDRIERMNARVLWAGTGLILLAIAWPILRGEVYVDSDLGRFHLQMRSFFADALAQGLDFHWYPYEFCGFHLHGEGQAALYHPLNWLSYGLLPFQLAFGLDLLRNYVFLFLGSFLYLRRSGLRSDAALLGSALFGFGSFSTFHFMHLNVLAIVAHLPWLAWAVDVVLRDERPSRVALAAVSVSLLIASQLLFGHPQFVWLCGVALGSLVFFRLVRGDGRRRWPWLVIAVLLGGGIGAVQVIPQWESLELSFRAAPGASFLDQLSLHPISFTLLVSPMLLDVDPHLQYRITNPRMRVGSFVPVLVMWLVVRWRSLGSSRPALAALAAMALLSLVLAVGHVGGLWQVVSLLPVVGLFRAPVRYLMIMQIAMCVVAALAFADLARFSERGARIAPRQAAWLFVPAVASFLLTSTAWLMFPHGPGPSLMEGPLLLTLGVVLPAGFAVAVTLAARGRGWVLPLALAFALLEIGAYGLTWIHRTPPTTIEAYLESFGPVPQTDGERIRSVHPAMVLRGFHLAAGYAAMPPRGRLEIFNHLHPPGDGGVSRTFVQKLRVASVGWAEGITVPDPMPRVRLVGRAVVDPRLHRAMGEIDIATTVVVVDDDVALDGEPPGPVDVLLDEPGHLRVRANARGRQMLIVAEGHHPGWRARVDGREAPILAAYGDFMGIELGAGEHEVTFDFEPDSVRMGREISVAGLALLVPFGFCVWRFGASPARADSRSRTPPSSSPS